MSLTKTIQLLGYPHDPHDYGKPQMWWWSWRWWWLGGWSWWYVMTGDGDDQQCRCWWWWWGQGRPKLSLPIKTLEKTTRTIQGENSSLFTDLSLGRPIWLILDTLQKHQLPAGWCISWFKSLQSRAHALETPLQYVPFCGGMFTNLQPISRNAGTPSGWFTSWKILL